MSITIRRPIANLPSTTLRRFRDQAGEVSKGLLAVIENKELDAEAKQDATDLLKAVLADLVLIDITLKQRGAAEFAADFTA